MSIEEGKGERSVYSEIDTEITTARLHPMNFSPEVFNVALDQVHDRDKAHMPDSFGVDRNIDIGRGAELPGNGDIDMVFEELEVITIIGRLAAGEVEELPSYVGPITKPLTSLGL
jgi:hypothetical protein